MAALVASVGAQKNSDRWQVSFRAFLKQLNLFILDLNDGTFDARRWVKVQRAWKDLEN